MGDKRLGMGRESDGDGVEAAGLGGLEVEVFGKILADFVWTRGDEVEADLACVGTCPLTRGEGGSWMRIRSTVLALARCPLGVSAPFDRFGLLTMDFLVVEDGEMGL